MTAYGILVTDTTWANHDSVEIDKAARLRHQDRLVDGTKALIYVRAPVDALVAEAEVTGDIVEIETEPTDPAFNPAIPANLRSERAIERIETEAAPTPAVTQEVANTYRVPLKLVRLKGGPAHPAQPPANHPRQRRQRLRRNLDSAEQGAV
ncbi:MAG: hypothetical protein U0703_00510 [Anaerolineae bacterium]